MHIDKKCILFLILIVFIQGKLVIVISEPWERPVVNNLTNNPCVWISSSIHGHYAVTSLTILSLQRAGYDVAYNPTCWWRNDLGNTVIMTNTFDAVTAIRLKKAGRAGIVLAGPNVYVTKVQRLDFDAIDGWIVPSTWVADMITLHWPFYYWNLLVWPNGVDEDYWTPTRAHRHTNGSQVVVYIKTTPRPELLKKIGDFLEKEGYRQKTIIYGSYNASHYLEVLRNAHFMIVFSVSESQGIFLAEAWSTNVPTYVFAADSWQTTWENKMWFSSPSPYLSPLTGVFFNTFEQLQSLVEYNAPFRPREWLLKHQSSRAAGRMIRKSIEKEIGRSQQGYGKFVSMRRPFGDGAKASEGRE